MQTIISNIIITTGLIFCFFGVFGIFRFKAFYSRMLVAAKIETVGFITVIIGLIVRHGLSFFSAKLLLMLIIMLVINPLTAHVLTRSAYLSGYRPDNTDNEKDDI